MYAYMCIDGCRYVCLYVLRGDIYVCLYVLRGGSCVCLYVLRGGSCVCLYVLRGGSCVCLYVLRGGSYVWVYHTAVDLGLLSVPAAMEVYLMDGSDKESVGAATLRQRSVGRLCDLTPSQQMGPGPCPAVPADGPRAQQSQQTGPVPSSPSRRAPSPGPCPAVPPLAPTTPSVDHGYHWNTRSAMITTGIPGLPWLPLEYQVCHDYHWNTRSAMVTTGIPRSAMITTGIPGLP